MRELWFWRTTSAILAAGWAWTWMSTATPPVAAHPLTVDVARPHAAAATERPARTALRRPVDPATPATAPASATDGAPSEAMIAAARAEVLAELQERRAAWHEERLADRLDEATAFADAHDLSDAAAAALQDAVLRLHERMRAVHADEDPTRPPGPPDDAHRAAMREAFDALDADLREALGDELAEAWHEEHRPGPGGRGGPPR